MGLTWVGRLASLQCGTAFGDKSCCLSVDWHDTDTRSNRGHTEDCVFCCVIRRWQRRHITQQNTQRSSLWP